MVGFKGDLIHSFNKNERVVTESEYFAHLKKRENILLLGDSLGDLGMVDEKQHPDVLKIGFLNDKVSLISACYKRLLALSHSSSPHHHHIYLC